LSIQYVPQENTTLLRDEDQLFMLFKETIAVCSEIHTECIAYIQNEALLLIVKAGGTLVTTQL
jgi:hypothetical protein